MRLSLVAAGNFLISEHLDAKGSHHCPIVVDGQDSFTKRTSLAEHLGFISFPSDTTSCSSDELVGGVDGGVNIVISTVEDTVNWPHAIIWRRSSEIVILSSGMGWKTCFKMLFSSYVRGRIFRRVRERVNARYVGSLSEARCHGLRPQVKLTRMTPSDQTSLDAQI